MKPGMSRPFSLMHHLMSKFKPGDLVKCQIGTWSPDYLGILIEKHDTDALRPMPWDNDPGPRKGWWVFMMKGPPRYFDVRHITLIQEDTSVNPEGTQEQEMMATKK